MLYKILILVLFTTILFSSPGHTSEKEIFLTSTEYPPYYGQELKNNGFITEVIKAAFEKMGYKIKVEFFPWLRSKAMAESGDSDGMYTLWHTEEREKWFVFSDPIPPHNTIGVYKRSDREITFETYRDLKPYIIGSVLGYAYSPEFMAAELKGLRLYTDEKLITKLVQGRVDLAIIDKIQGNYLFKKRFSMKNNKFEFMEPPLEIRQQHLVISKKINSAHKIINDFNDGLEEIMNNGFYDDILDEHGF